MQTLAFWHNLTTALANTGRIALVQTAAAEKGSPGNPGFTMAIWLDEQALVKVLGTIGGGIMEKDIIAEAAHALEAQVNVRLCRKLHHFKHPEKTPSGLICAGSQTILLQTLTHNDLPTLRTIAEAVEHSTPILAHTSPIGLRAETAREDSPPFAFEYESENTWSFRELLGAPHTAYIVGGGHVGLALSRQLSWLNWRTILIDDRDVSTTDTLRQNTFADRIITASYDTLAEIIPESERTYITILTSAYRTDVQALVSLAGGQKSAYKCAYIGLMGSRAKIATIFREAEARGVSKDWLVSIHAPLGANINSDTPEEIAVSIAAEMIGVKNGEKKMLQHKA
jgi:xanthine dehydrogenase accessory factor